MVLLLSITGCAAADSPEGNQTLGRTTGALSAFSAAECTCGRLEIVTAGIVIDCSGPEKQSLFMNIQDLPRNHERFEFVGNVQFLTGMQPMFFEVERGPTRPDPRSGPRVYDYFPLIVHHAVLPASKVCDDLANIGSGECRSYLESEMSDARFWCYQ